MYEMFFTQWYSLPHHKNLTVNTKDKGPIDLLIPQSAVDVSTQRILLRVSYYCVSAICVSHTTAYLLYVSHTTAYGQVCTYGLRVHAMKASIKSTKNTAEDCRRGPPEGGMRAV